MIRNTKKIIILGATSGIGRELAKLYAKENHKVGITSVAGIRGSKMAPAYNASKSYQINYLEGMKQKAASLKKPVYVTDIRPGFVDTDMAKGEGLFWVSSIEKAGKQIYTAIKNKKKIAYISKRWRLVSVILKRIPNVIYERM
jgi:short-subunit dehydrogenase